MTESKQEITPTPPVEKLELFLSTDQENDFKLVKEKTAKNPNYVLFLKVQELLGSDVVMYRGKPAFILSTKEKKWLDDHPGEIHWSAPYLAYFYLNGKQTGLISVIQTQETVFLSGSKFPKQTNLNCKNNLQCAQSTFEFFDQDREGIEKILSKKKVGDWLIRRGSNNKALVISFQGIKGVHHSQFLPTSSGWVQSPGSASFENIQDVFQGMGLLLSNSTLYIYGNYLRMDE